MKITNEDVEWFKDAHNIVRKGFFPNGQKAIEDYKRIFADEIANGKMRSNLNPKCGSCIKEAVQKVYRAIINLEKKLEDDKQGNKEKD